MLDHVLFCTVVASRVSGGEKKNAAFALFHTVLSPLRAAEIQRFLLLSPTDTSSSSHTRELSVGTDQKSPTPSTRSTSLRSDGASRSQAPPPPAVSAGAVMYSTADALPRYVSLFGIRTVVDLMVHLQAPFARGTCFFFFYCAILNAQRLTKPENY